MKIKILSVMLSAALLLGVLSGCGKAGYEDSSKVSIVATVFPQYDFARQIAGDRAEITLLLKPGMEAHSYEPTPKDIIRISHCDLFLNVGGESESWLDSVFDSVDNNKMKIVSAMDCVSGIAEEHSDGMTEKGHAHEHDEDCHEEHDHDEDEVEYDEHVWTSPINAILIVSEILRALCEVDPNNAEYYTANANEYIAQVTGLDSEIRDIVANAARGTLIFGDRFPLLYFVKEYGLDYYAAFPGCASETEPSATTVAFLVDKVKQDDIPVIFYIELSNHKVADAIAECTGAKALQFNTCHNITADDFEAGETYLSLMTANLSVLKEALN
ncbi:MAG: metal ABC transporter substrate-binding protein [Firmicutes bacterium]|nr:metal ABC transporter substrate-binding protein [Bacillota bacterium]